jgi:hypothetical protein
MTEWEVTVIATLKSTPLTAKHVMVVSEHDHITDVAEQAYGAATYIWGKDVRIIGLRELSSPA